MWGGTGYTSPVRKTNGSFQEAVAKRILPMILPQMILPPPGWGQDQKLNGKIIQGKIMPGFACAPPGSVLESSMWKTGRPLEFMLERLPCPA